MTDKQKITTIYVSAAAICVLILLTTWFIQGTHLKPPPAPEPQYVVDEMSGPLLTCETILASSTKMVVTLRFLNSKARCGHLPSFMRLVQCVPNATLRV